MHSRRPRGQLTAFVTLVSSNRETVDGVDAYLRRAGVDTATARTLKRIGPITPTAATAVVVFPDDFELENVLREVGALRAARPDLLVIVVTMDPNGLAARDGAYGTDIVVIPRPAWGWTILDAIRARRDRPTTCGVSRD